MDFGSFGSIWDAGQNAWNALTGGGSPDISTGDLGVPSPSSGSYSAAGDYAPTALTGLDSLPSSVNSAADAFGSTPNLPNAGSFSAGLQLPGDSSTPSGVASGAAASQPQYMAGLDAANAAGGPISDGANGTTATTSPEGTDWKGMIKKNAGLITPAINAIGTLSANSNNSPSPASQQQGQIATNVANTGASMVNQAPFMGQNSQNQAMIAGAAGKAALQQQLQRQGYKAGDAAYDSAMNTQDIGNRTNEATAYAAGQGQSMNAESTGAGLQTNASAGLNNLSNNQNAQQQNQNKSNTALLGDFGQGLAAYAGS